MFVSGERPAARRRLGITGRYPAGRAVLRLALIMMMIITTIVIATREITTTNIILIMLKP